MITRDYDLQFKAIIHEDGEVEIQPINGGDWPSGAEEAMADWWEEYIQTHDLSREDRQTRDDERFHRNR